MVVYSYVAKNTETDQIVRAEVQAENEQAAAKLLIGQKLFPITIEVKGEGGRLADFHIGSGIPAKARIIFTRQLSTLIGAGLPLLQSLRTVHDQVSNKRLQAIVLSIITAVEGGSSLSDAFMQHPEVFNQIYTSLLQAGETSGTLDKVLERIASQEEKDAQILSKIRGALIYPAIVLVVILLVLVFMLVAVLPQIANLYSSLGQSLPLLTRILSDTANLLIHFWWLAILVLIVLGIFAARFFRSSEGSRFLDAVKLRMPVFGTIFHKMYMARFSRTLGSLLASGVPMLQGMEVVRKAVGNSLVAEDIDAAAVQVKGGKALSTSLEDKSTFLILVPQMIKIGEQSGAIDAMLDKVAGYYEDEVDSAVADISTTIEPVLMVVLGLLVAFIIAAILLPVYSLIGSGTIGG